MLTTAGPTTDPAICSGAGYLCLRSDVSGETWITIRGALDAAAAPDVGRMLRDAQAAARVVVIDLRETERIDAAGVQVLLAAHRRSSACGGRLVALHEGSQSDTLGYALAALRMTGLHLHAVTAVSPDGSPSPHGASRPHLPERTR